MADQMKNMLIGLFVLAAFAIVVFVLMFLHPYVGDEGKLLHVRFSNIDKISLGTRVTFAGKPVGEVIDIRELEDVLTERVAKDGNVYVYELTLRVDSSVNVFNTDQITSRTSGLLGEKSVAIIPGPPEPGEKLRIINEEIIYAVESGNVEETLKQFKHLGDKVEIMLDDLIATFDTFKKQKIWESLGKTSRNLRDITTALNHPEKWEKTLENVYDLSKRALKSWDTVDSSLKDISTVAQNSVLITDSIRRGEGTIGKLVSNEELYLRTTSLFSKAEVLLNDVNHYGVLFHLDKGWQRLRARRLNLLQKLCSPQEFRNFFNDELDMVTASLERVSMVLDNSGLDCTCYSDLILDREFNKVYAELLRRVASIEEALKMYNQQLVDTQVMKTEFNEECCFE